MRAAMRGLGRVELARMQPSDVEAWIGDVLAQGRKASTVALWRRVLVMALTDAERDGLITRNAARLSRPPRQSESPPRALTADERTRLVAAARADATIGPVVLLALSTGLRRGELLALRWEDVGPSSVTVTGSLTLGPRGDWIRSEPKTRRARRTVGLPAMGRDALVRQREAAEGSPWVFPGPTGEPFDPRNFTYAYKALTARAGLSGVRLHDLRHTAATLALAAGLPVRDVADALGHSSPSITLDVYGHAIPEGPSRVADALDKALGS
jgi:integrase